MSKALVVYYSQSGNTEKMAQAVHAALEEEGVEAVLKKVEDIVANELLKYDAIIMGSPTYYGSMAWQLKKIIDESVKFHGQLKGRIGGAFSSARNIGGGNETTIEDILNAMLIHGMIIQGEPKGDHYGPVAIGAPDKRATDCCVRLAKNVAALLKNR